MGHPLIDEQHRMLVHMIGELRARMEAGEHRQGVLDALQGMLAYAATHFEDEEEIMEEADWKGLERHEGLHAEFLWKAGDLEAQVKDDSAKASREALEYLYNWLMEHILVEDRAFFASLRA
jgi:hemerythrin-like metal-binding protein